MDKIWACLAIRRMTEVINLLCMRYYSSKLWKKRSSNSTSKTKEWNTSKISPWQKNWGWSRGLSCLWRLLSGRISRRFTWSEPIKKKIIAVPFALRTWICKKSRRSFVVLMFSTNSASKASKGFKEQEAMIERALFAERKTTIKNRLLKDKCVS